MAIRLRALATATLAASVLAAGGAQTAMAATAAPAAQPKTGVIAVYTLKNGTTATVSLEKAGTAHATVAPSISVHPMTAVNCKDDGGIISAYTHETCFGIYGSGNYVSYMKTTTINATGYPIKMHVDIQTGAGAVMQNTAWVSVPSGDEISVTWTIESTIADTTYCGGGFGNDGYTGYVCEPITG